MDTGKVILKVEGLTTSFKTKNGYNPVARNISFELRSSEILGIVGESGSGKSVSSLSLIQLLPRSITQIESIAIQYLKEDEFVDLAKLNENQIRQFRGKEIAVIFQEPLSAFNPSMRLGKQLLEAYVQYNPNALNPAHYIRGLIKRVKLDNVDQIYQAYPHQLSGGQLQRVMIAMALTCKPKILIADEPTTALDVGIQKSILALLNELKNEYNLAIIFISHELGLVKEFCDKVIIMQKGVIVETGTTNQIFKTPNHPYTKGLLACTPPLKGKMNRLPTMDYFLKSPTSSVIEFQKNNFITEQEVQNHLKNIERNESVIEVKSLSKLFVREKNWYGKPISIVQAVDDASFELKKGEILGLVGESGSGKTTLSNLINGSIKADSGEVLFKGNSLSHFNKKEWKRYYKSMQYIFQNPYSSLNPKIQIGPSIKEPMDVHHLLGSNSERKQKAIDLLFEVGLDETFYNRFPSQLSGGQRQRVVIARALAIEPEILICDECVSALDVSVQATIINLLLELRKKRNLSYIFISHDLAVVRFISDRVMVMKNGRIVEKVTAENFIEKATHPYTKSLIEAMPQII